MSKFITEDILNDYRKDGVVCLRGVFSDRWIQQVIKGIDRNLQNPSAYSERLLNNGETGGFFNDYCNWKSIPEFQEFVYQSPAAAIAGIVMESPISIFYHEHVLIKEAGTSKLTPWHHDQAYYPINGFKNCSIWMPLDTVPIENSVKFAAGSHLDSKWYRPRKFATHLNYVCDNETNGFIDTNQYVDVPDNEYIKNKYKILRFSVAPGDCIVFHMRTLHAAPGVLKSTSRRVLSTRWLGDDSTFATRPWITSPPLTGIDLLVGQSVNESQKFPVVWKRDN
ncbi:uncharacterized protein LOC128961026 [Oppia nitens]|uniref:uncharacterized protein LOC128961026 n=1 Tax=Oppia nitens TaxID=1686743 RepID=UPI0023DA3B45|nr:uncharacterized protein LOC128961026 [Oppia nitens]